MKYSEARNASLSKGLTYLALTLRSCITKIDVVCKFCQGNPMSFEMKRHEMCKH